MVLAFGLDPFRRISVCKIEGWVPVKGIAIGKTAYESRK